MAKKTLIIDPAGRQKVPFLRGILVQSLVAAGLAFKDAYATAQAVRDELEKVDEISSPELRALVARQLEQRFGAEVRQGYVSTGGVQKEVIVHTRTRVAPFSVGILTRYLEGCAIGREQALSGARDVHEYLRKRGLRRIDSPDLRKVIFNTLKQGCCADAADRYLSRTRFEASGEPLIILLGGTTGAGKSTVTSELAYRLNIVRTQSTDIMREIIRCYLAPHVVPTLAFSSYDAWRGLPKVPHPGERAVAEDPVIAGYLSQFGTVRVALEATVARAVKERHHLIIDGIHVLPSHLKLTRASKRSILVSAFLAVTTLEKLESHLATRSLEQSERNSAKYRKHLQAIWHLQSYMLDQAERAGVPVIANWDLEESVDQVLELVMKRIRERFPPDPSALG